MMLSSERGKSRVKEGSGEGNVPPLGDQGGRAHALLYEALSRCSVNVCGIEALILWMDPLGAGHFHNTSFIPQLRLIMSAVEGGQPAPPSQEVASRVLLSWVSGIPKSRLLLPRSPPEGLPRNMHC